MLLRCSGDDRRALPAGGPGRPGRFLLQRRRGADNDDGDDDAHVPGFLEGFEDESDDDDEPRVTARCFGAAVPYATCWSQRHKTCMLAAPHFHFQNRVHFGYFRLPSMHGLRLTLNSTPSAMFAEQCASACAGCGGARRAAASGAAAPPAAPGGGGRPAGPAHALPRPPTGQPAPAGHPAHVRSART